MAEGNYNNVGAISEGVVTWDTSNVTGDDTKIKWRIINRVVIASLEFTPLSGRIIRDYVICTGLPIPYNDMPVCESNGRSMAVRGNGTLQWWFPTNTTDLSRIDITLVYIS